MWNVADAEEIKPHTLEIMNYVKPRPDYLIIGTGEKQVSLDFTFYEHFRRMGITVDSCPSVRLLNFLFFLQFEACSTFNLCNEDGYNVACALV
jgi:NADH dehydrogenase [ubiquinone] 1 alpha subcomplex assembly factor 3